MATQLPQYEVLRRQYLAQDPELQRLNQQQAQARGQLYAAPFQAREQYQNIFNPIEREKLISQAVGNVLGQLSGFNTLIEQRGGQAQQAAKLATDYMAEQNAAKEAQAKQAQQDFENQIALAKLEIDRTKAGAGTEDEDISGFVSLALENAENPDFDFSTFLTSIPSGQRNTFLNEYQAALRDLSPQGSTETQAQATDQPRATGPSLLERLGLTQAGRAIKNIRVPDITSKQDLEKSIQSLRKRGSVRGGQSPAYQKLQRRGFGGL